MKIRVTALCVLMFASSLLLSACDPTQPNPPITPAPPVTPPPPIIPASYEKVTCGPMKQVLVHGADPFSHWYLRVTRLEDNVQVKFDSKPTKIEFFDSSYDSIGASQLDTLQKAGAELGTATLTFQEANRSVNIEFNGGTPAQQVFTIRSWDQYGAYSRGTSVHFGSNKIHAYSSNVHVPAYNTANVGSVGSEGMGMPSNPWTPQTTWDGFAIYGSDNQSEGLQGVIPPATINHNVATSIGEGLSAQGFFVTGDSSGVGQYRAHAKFTLGEFPLGCKAETYIGS